MTETSGFADTHEGALKLAGAMHNALRYGHAEAWVFWTLAEPTRSAYSLFSKTLERSKRYYVSKNFYRYVRPGAVRAEASAGDETILPLAFAEGNRQVLILINVGTTDRVVKLSGAGLKTSFRAYRTSETENCQDLGTYSGPAVILPRQSVTTWVSE
jgi:glucuronoarabinoxylan endo-1,4-beta-xylanase